MTVSTIEDFQNRFFPIGAYFVTDYSTKGHKVYLSVVFDKSMTPYSNFYQAPIKISLNDNLHTKKLEHLLPEAFSASGESQGTFGETIRTINEFVKKTYHKGHEQGIDKDCDHCESLRNELIILKNLMRKDNLEKLLEKDNKTPQLDSVQIEMITTLFKTCEEEWKKVLGVMRGNEKPAWLSRSSSAPVIKGSEATAAFARRAITPSAIPETPPTFQAESPEKKTDCKAPVAKKPTPARRSLQF